MGSLFFFKKTYSLLLFFLLFSSLNAVSQSDLDGTPSWVPAQQNLRTFKDTGVNQDVDPYTGDLKLVSNDVYLPGNGGLNINVNRVYDTGTMRYGASGWLKPNAHVFSSKWIGLGLGWSLNIAPKVIISPVMGSAMIDWIGKPLEPAEDWVCGGNSNYYARRIAIEHSDGRAEPLLHSQQGSIRSLISSGNWKVTCSGSVYTLHSPDGTKFLMGLRDTNRFEIPYLKFNGLIRPDTVLYATRQTDSNGNYLDFTYQQFGVGLFSWYDQVNWQAYLPTAITSSDGRSVQFIYDAGKSNTSANGYPPRLLSITVNGQITTRYVYSYIGTLGVNAWDNADNPHAGGYHHLTEVLRVDGTKWQFSYWPNGTVTDSRRLRLRTTTLPTGGTTNYDYSQWSYRECQGGNIVYVGQVASVTNSNGNAWAYTYQRANAGGQFDVTTIVGPSHTETYKYFGVGYFMPTGWGSVDMMTRHACGTGATEPWRLGLLAEHTINGMQSVKNTWVARTILNTPIPAPAQYAYAPAQCIFSKIKLGCVLNVPWEVPFLSKVTITRDGVDYSTIFSTPDIYGNASTIIETGPNSGNRTTTHTYLNDTTKWIIGKPKNESFAGGSTTRNFDANGNLLSVTENGITTSYTYDSQGGVASKILPRGLVHQYSSYKRGIPQTETQPEGITISRIVDNAGNITSETNGEGKTTSYTYDLLNRVTSEIYPIGLQKTISYTATSKTATRGVFVGAMQRNSFGEVTSTSIGGVVTTFNYDASGRKIFESYPNSTNGTSYSYDALNRITRVTNGDSTYKSYSYGASNVAITNERNYTTTYYYRSYGNPNEKHLIRIDAPNPSANIVITRNVRDQITSVTQAGLTRSYGYDANYYLTSVVNPETGNTVYGRDIAGNMTSSKVGVSGVTNYTYDQQNRLTQIVYPDGTPTVTHTYNKRNDLLSSNSTSGNRGFVYDANGNITLESLQIGTTTYSLNYAYNGNDHLSSITYPLSRRVVNYAPDVLGRATQVSGYITNVSYWPSGLLKQINYANGTVSQYYQNSRLWPSSFKTHKPGSATYFDSNYSYDGVGNLTLIYDEIDDYNYRNLNYDSIDRLIGAEGPFGSGTINYDGAGNITRQQFGAWNINYSYSSNNLLGSVSGSRTASYGYDVYGNLSSNGSNNFTYNANSNLKCINCGTSNAINFSYDGTNQRSAVVRPNNAITYEMYNSKGLLMHEEFSSGQPYRFIEYIYLDNKRIAEHEGTKISYFHNDISGSPVLATNANGAQLWKETYRPYGDKIKNSVNKIGFHGKPYDGDVGLSYMGARYYDPTLGRFMGIDPVDFQENNLHSFNRYSYANNNPYKFVDPDGKVAVLLLFAPELLVATKALLFVGSAATVAAVASETIDTSGESSGSSDTADFEDIPQNKPPFTGEPGSTVRGGTGSRTYGEDGYPKTDRDLPHPDEAGIGCQDHCHDWSRPEDGSPPTHEDRGTGRAPEVGDPPAPRGPNVPPPDLEKLRR